MLGISKQRLILLVASALGAIAAFLPWATFLRISLSGFEGYGHGRITVALFAAACLICLFGKMKKPLSEVKYLVLAAGVVSVGVAVFNIVNLVRAGAGVEMSLAPGVGLYLTLLAGLALVVVPFLKLDKA
ncbi:MAG: hypothetical protein FWC72_08055 [Oscillospiraceae bacterium]|nr:hypothetical protein [Oscillospiraceae bacterium]